MIPTEVGYYWATLAAMPGRRIIVAVYWHGKELAVMNGLGNTPLEHWSDWQGPIVEECPECEGRGFFGSVEMEKMIPMQQNCWVCDGSGRRGT